MIETKNKFMEEDTKKLNPANNLDEEETIIPNSKHNNFDEEETIIPDSKHNNFDEEETIIPNSKHNNFDEEETIIPNSDKNNTKTDIVEYNLSNINEEETFILPNSNGTNTQQVFDIKTDNNIAPKNISVFTKVKKYKAIIITVIGIFIFLALLITTLQTYNANKKRLLKIKLKKREINLKNRVNDLYFLGINEYKLQKWDSAIKYFSKILALKPHYTKALEYQKNSKKEKKTETLFNKSKVFFSEKKYSLSLNELKKINENSYYYIKAKNLKKEIEKQQAKEQENLENKKIEQELEEEVKKDENTEIAENDKPIIINKSKKHHRRVVRIKKIKKVSHKELEKAKSLYIKAYQEENRYPKKAQKKYKAIMKLLPSTEALYKKAKRRLKKLK